MFSCVAPCRTRKSRVDCMKAPMMPGDAARVRAIGVDEWIALQLAPDRIDDRATDALVASYEGLRIPTSDLVAADVQAQQALRQLQQQAAQRAMRGLPGQRVAC